MLAREGEPPAPRVLSVVGKRYSEQLHVVNAADAPEPIAQWDTLVEVKFLAKEPFLRSGFLEQSPPVYSPPKSASETWYTNLDERPCTSAILLWIEFQIMGGGTGRENPGSNIVKVVDVGGGHGEKREV